MSVQSPRIPPLSVRPPRDIALGRSGFIDRRRTRAWFADKSLFIQHVLFGSHDCMLIPRPRRFGKTLNLSMLQAFLENTGESVADCFEDLLIWQDLRAREHFQQYPVLFFTFKDCKGNTWPRVFAQIQAELLRMFQKHRAIRTTPGILDEAEAAWFDAVVANALVGNVLPGSHYAQTLRVLSAGLSRLYKTKVVLLIDEYDTPIHSALENGYYKEAVGFFRPFLGTGFKDNPHLFRGVITGILRVSKENMFSDLNNVGVFHFLRDEFRADFGLTEAEVVQLLEEQGCPELLPALREAYNGYQFGEQQPLAIYNPWSVMSCVGSEGRVVAPYWHDSGSPALLHEVLLKGGPGLHAELERLLKGESIRVSLHDHIDLTKLHWNSSQLLSFMTFTGYLKATSVVRRGMGLETELTVVNRELSHILSDLYVSWLQSGLKTRSLEGLVRAVLEGDVKSLEEQLQRILIQNASLYDGATRKPENFYQGLILGLLTQLRETHEVRSNLESGHGRADLLVLPREPGRAGVVLELKVARSVSGLEGALLEALEQSEARGYRKALEARGANPLHVLGVAVVGKRVRVAGEVEYEGLKARVEARTQESSRGRTLKGGAEGVASAVAAFPLQERLALEKRVLPLLTERELERLWLRLGLPVQDFCRADLPLAWERLVSYCIQARKRSELAILLADQLPALADEPLLVRLQTDG